MEQMEESLQRISRKLGKAYKPLSVQHLNLSERISPVPYELKEEWERKNTLECLVYNYVQAKYNQNIHSTPLVKSLSHAEG